MIIQTYYIGTGRKNAMYTLRCCRDPVGTDLGGFRPDFYVCNLAATEDLAIEKAADFVERMRDRIGETSDFKIVFDDVPHAENYKRRGRLSVGDTMRIEAIEAGVFPFGKHRDKLIAEAPDSYILFFADKQKDYPDNPVMLALSTACMGVALDRGLLAKREARKAEIAEADARSKYVGKVGDRLDFKGVVEVAYEKRGSGAYDNPIWINKIRCGQNVVMYFGSKALGAVGAHIEFKATVKSHEIYNGIEQTIVSRPY